MRRRNAQLQDSRSTLIFAIIMPVHKVVVFVRKRARLVCMKLDGKQLTYTELYLNQTCS